MDGCINFDSGYLLTQVLKLTKSKYSTGLLFLQEQFIMNKKCVENVALTFIQERLFQTLDKQNGQKISPIGLITESSMRACLREIFKIKGISIADKNKDSELILCANDFIEAGVKKTTPFINKIGKTWRQCDICIKLNGHEKIHGEIKTTTSAHHNICILINKNLTTIRSFDAKPLSVILYPALRQETLFDRHHSFVKGLLQSDKINKKEYDILIECFFIITKNKTDSQMKRQIKKMGELKLEEINSYRDPLFEKENINFVEWNRLINYISKSIS